MSKKIAVCISFFLFIILSVFLQGAAYSQSMDIKQKSEAYIGQPVTFEVSGEITQNNRVNFEWAFSNNVSSILIGRGGSSCSFTVHNTSPVALSLKAIDENGQVISETFLMTAAREYDVEIRPIPVTMVTLWNTKTRSEEAATEFAVNQRLSFEAIISPDLKERLNYKWKMSSGVSFDLPLSGKSVTIWREEPGICSIEVEVTNRNGILLGKGIAFEEITISDSILKESENHKKSWEKWNEALRMWNDSDFMNVEGYENALALALEAIALNEDDNEISDGVKSMKTDNTSIQRAKEFALEGEELRGREKWTESLAAYRRSFVIWRVPETEQAIRDIEETVRTIRLNREKAAWLRDMAKAYEDEKLYKDAINAYEESLALDRQEAAIKGIERAEALHENLMMATALNSEALDLIISGDYLAATGKLKESLKLLSDDITRKKLKDLEILISELKERALKFRQAGNEHAKQGRNPEALACYSESMRIWADTATENLVNKFEEIVPEDQRLRGITAENLSLERKAESARLLREGTEFYRAGNYKEALSRYKKSYEIDENKQLRDWIERIEGSLKAQASIDESNRLIRQGNALYSIHRYKEALECYLASMELYPNKEIEDFIKHIEEILYN